LNRSDISRTTVAHCSADRQATRTAVGNRPPGFHAALARASLCFHPLVESIRPAGMRGAHRRYHQGQAPATRGARTDCFADRWGTPVCRRVDQDDPGERVASSHWRALRAHRPTFATGDSRDTACLAVGTARSARKGQGRRSDRRSHRAGVLLPTHRICRRHCRTEPECCIGTTRRCGADLPTGCSPRCYVCFQARPRSGRGLRKSCTSAAAKIARRHCARA